VYFTILAFTTV